MYIMFPYLAVPYMVIVPRLEILFIIILINIHCFNANFETWVIKCFICLSHTSQVLGGNPKENMSINTFCCKSFWFFLNPCKDNCNH